MNQTGETTMNTWTSLDVCPDCLMMIANGETDPNWTESECNDFIARFTKSTEGYASINPGSDHKNCTHDLQGEDCPLDEGHFSWSPCDLCKSSLGGDRYPAMAEYRKFVSPFPAIA